MRITVLGKSPSWQDAGGACSGYLVAAGGRRAAARLRQRRVLEAARLVDYVDVGAVVISHLHADHFLDLVPFSYALTYAPRQQPVPVAGWPGTEQAGAAAAVRAGRRAERSFRQIVGCWGHDDLIEHAFELHEYDGPDELDVGPFKRPLLRGAALHADVRGRRPLERQPADLQRRLQPERRSS